MAFPGFAVDGALVAFAYVVGTVLFGVGATATVIAIRHCLGHARAPAILAGFGVLTALPVVFLWFDGRIARYFVPSFWLVVALGLPAGAATALRSDSPNFGTAAWVGVFAVVFAFRLPLDVAIGGAAVVGFVIEALAVTFTALPVVAAGTVIGSLVRTYSTAPCEVE